MSKDKNQYWTVISPDGNFPPELRRTRKLATRCWGGTKRAWKRFYRQGYRCVKVWVYQEKRELPTPIKHKPFVPKHGDLIMNITA